MFQDFQKDDQVHPLKPDNYWHEDFHVRMNWSVKPNAALPNNYDEHCRALSKSLCNYIYNSVRGIRTAYNAL